MAGPPVGGASSGGVGKSDEQKGAPPPSAVPWICQHEGAHLF